MNDSADTQAARSFQRSIDWLLAAVRIAGVAQFAMDCASESKHVKRRWPLVAGFCALGAHNGLEIYRRWKVPTGADEPSAWRDAVIGVGTVAIEGVAAGGLNRGAGAKPGDYVLFAGMLTALQAEGPGTAVPRICILAGATALLNIGTDFSTAKLLSETLGTMQMQIATFATSQMRIDAERLDLARRQAVERASQQAAVDERRAQHRFLHDSALQILEVVAGNWPVDPTVLRERVTFEAERLAAAARGVRATDDSLAAALERLAAAFGDDTFEVRLELEPGAEPAPTVTAGTSDAVREALVNVVKHAQIGHATVTVARTATGIEVCVRDEGRGFDPANDPHGFGLSQSIGDRIAGLGGTTTITSQPGRGTQVILTLPVAP